MDSTARPPRRTEHPAPPRGRRRRWFRRHSRTTVPRVEGLLRVAAVDRHISPFDAIDRPGAAMVLAEDACWQFARLDCDARRPPWWRLPARRAWRAESARLQGKRARIAELAREVRTY